MELDPPRHDKYRAEFGIASRATTVMVVDLQTR